MICNTYLAVRAYMTATGLHLLVNLFNSGTFSTKEGYGVRNRTLDETIAFHGSFGAAGEIYN